MSSKTRLKQNRDLPKRWVRKHNAIYYRVPESQKGHWDNKSWFLLGKTLAEAHKTFSERVHDNPATKVLTMQDLLDRFEFEHLPTLKPASRKYWLYALPMLRKVFTTNPIPVKAIEPQHAYQMADFLQRTETTKKAIQASECLSSALSFAVKKGIIARNPLKGQFKKPSLPGRDHYVTDEELIGYASILPRKWQLYISLKLHTKGRRKGELLRLRRSHLTNDGILFTNNKRTSDKFIIKWTPELQRIIEEILELHPKRIGDAPLFFGRGFKAYINDEGGTSGFDSIWQRYMKKAVGEGLCERFTEHDLRAKAVENESLEVAALLLRHTSTTVTAKHYRRKPEQL